MSRPSPASHERASPIRLAPVEQARWESFAAGTASARIYHSSLWLDLLAQVHGLAWQPLGVWSRSQLAGIFPLQTRRLGPFVLAGSPLMQVIGSMPFLGPVVDPGLLPAVLEALEPVMCAGRVSHIEITLPWLVRDPAALHRLGYTTETCQAVVLPLAGRDGVQLWQGLSSACRRAVRKAQSRGVIVVEAVDASFLPEYTRMVREVYRGAGRPPHLSEKFLAAAWDALAPHGQLKALLARQGDAVIAGALFLLGRATVYYLSGAAYRHGLPARPNNLLQWHMIEWAAAQGYQAYDLGGVAVPSITRFKRSFGGELYPYTRLFRANSQAARLGRKAYARLIPLWRRLQAGGA